MTKPVMVVKVVIAMTPIDNIDYVRLYRAARYIRAVLSGMNERGTDPFNDIVLNGVAVSITVEEGEVGAQPPSERN